MKRGNKQKFYLQNVLTKHLLGFSGTIRCAFKSRSFLEGKWVAYPQVADSVLRSHGGPGRHGVDAHSGGDNE
jgi:hypothetical protein